MSDQSLPEWHAHCGCKLTVGADGEPVDFIYQCAGHQDAAPEDIAGENRAMTLVRIAISEAADIDINDTVASIDHASGQATCVSPDGKWTATSAAVTLAQYVSGQGSARTLATPL